MHTADEEMERRVMRKWPANLGAVVYLCLLPLAFYGPGRPMG
jgi:hypothetical protein